MRIASSMFIMILSCFILGTTPLYAQDCPIPSQIIDAVAICEGFNADTLCLVAGNVKVTNHNSTHSLAFSSSGDLLPIEDIASIELSADAAVLMHLSTGSENDHVTLGLALGSQQIDFLNPVIVSIPVTATTNANLRAGAGTSFATAGSLRSGSTANATGRNTAGDWVFITDENGQTGWVFVDLVTTEGDITSLAILDDTATTGPIGYELPILKLSSSDESTDCEANGLLIQTPSNAESELIINDVFVNVGSTIFFRLVHASNLRLVDEAAEVAQALMNTPNPDSDLILRAQTLQGNLRARAFIGAVSGYLEAENGLATALENIHLPISIPEGTEGLFAQNSEGGIVTQPVVVPYDEEALNVLMESLAPVFEAVAQDGTPITVATAPVMSDIVAPTGVYYEQGSWVRSVDIEEALCRGSGFTFREISGPVNLKGNLESLIGFPPTLGPVYIAPNQYQYVLEKSNFIAEQNRTYNARGDVTITLDSSEQVTVIYHISWFHSDGNNCEPMTVTLTYVKAPEDSLYHFSEFTGDRQVECNGELSLFGEFMDNQFENAFIQVKSGELIWDQYTIPESNANRYEIERYPDIIYTFNVISDSEIAISIVSSREGCNINPAVLTSVGTRNGLSEDAQSDDIEADPSEESIPLVSDEPIIVENGIYTFAPYQGDRDLICGGHPLALGKSFDETTNIVDVIYEQGSISIRFSNPPEPIILPQIEPNIYRGTYEDATIEIQVLSNDQLKIIAMLALGCDINPAVLTSIGTLSE